ncbi:hypothetical protein AURDEDRAFT_173041 [Auricularia subglabra TFB-10046 SS5]|uniref:Uncharacterized protein n=1 Tax=Auricularia subglabra (strain TFB-10046 / SS5) TaxID=717982 RepID=J0WV12_AURST|nr:hypothetical protein AURDEDRAFT_173041 [Auricularia subglabra TFB-10046 SS5]
MIQQHHGESNVRQRFTDASFSPSTSALGSGVVPVDSASWNKELNANASRIEGWRKTRSYEHCATDFAAQMEHSQFCGVDVTHHLACLLSPCFVQEVSEPAALVPASHSSLEQLALWLPGQVEGVRASTVGLLNQS